MRLGPVSSLEWRLSFTTIGHIGRSSVTYEMAYVRSLLSTWNSYKEMSPAVNHTWPPPRALIMTFSQTAKRLD